MMLCYRIEYYSYNMLVVYSIIMIGGILMGARMLNSLGEINITDEVLATLAGINTMECYGIVGMASKRATDGFVELLGKDNLSKGIKIQAQGELMVIDIFIIVEYGISITAVAKNVIDTVKYNVENITGMKINKVNVTVEGVRV